VMMKNMKICSICNAVNKLKQDFSLCLGLHNVTIVLL
jgi:hypothetical protein